ncbi:MAG: hypothetical protein C7B46_08235 [Sulfobacillus benefaciens]|uniref:AB hydrolase-1 domain-containing protein n=1 Tax=Sulfobacillus benefaciens TaxID=453960 RepID=A0A2T2XH35_9FIRM|nr:MAG: hypothetical protein C7B46_08235 [Sulfobacillus benefaciens]
MATMDLRGHGDSDASISKYDGVATGQDILALTHILGSPAIVVRNSMSAGWAAPSYAMCR